MKKRFLVLVLLMMISASAEEIVFTDMLEHKRECIAQIVQKCNNNNGLYPNSILPQKILKRVIKTINADDTDTIPKIPDAGKVIEENGERVQLMHNGIKVIENCYYGEWMTDIIHALRGHHEPQEEKVFYEVLKEIPPGATMIELGSYWGYYSLWFSKAVANAKNYLIEPLQENLDLGKKHFALNGKEAHFSLGFIQANPNDPLTFKGARRIEIDQYLEKRHIDHVNILHADIQGAEHAMLLSCQKAISNQQIDYFFISTHRKTMHDLCKSFLLAYNYQIIAEHTKRESCSGDGLIVARRNNLIGTPPILIRKYR